MEKLKVRRDEATGLELYEASYSTGSSIPELAHSLTCPSFHWSCDKGPVSFLGRRVAEGYKHRVKRELTSFVFIRGYQKPYHMEVREFAFGQQLILSRKSGVWHDEGPMIRSGPFVWGSSHIPSITHIDGGAERCGSTRNAWMCDAREERVWNIWESGHAALLWVVMRQNRLIKQSEMKNSFIFL